MKLIVRYLLPSATLKRDGRDRTHPLALYYILLLFSGF
jgi:hypothetical protein